MRINEIITETQVDEIDRRGFLKGMGAAAASAAGGVMAKPYRHGSNTDQLTGKTTGQNSKVDSEDGLAELYIQHGSSGEGAFLDLMGGMRFGFNDIHSSGKLQQPFRILMGGNVSSHSGLLSKDRKSMQLSGWDPKTLARKLLAHSGEIKIEVLMSNDSKKIFTFILEPDSVTKKYSSPEFKKAERAKAADIQKNDHLRRIKNSIRPNIVGQASGSVEVEIRVTSGGSIISSKVIKSSGDAGWDTAVLKGIERTTYLPRDDEGKIPEIIKLEFGR